MLKKTIGLVIFVMAFFSQIGIENILNYIDKQIFFFIAASSMGLFIVNFRNGMRRTFYLSKLKKYVLFSGIIASMIQFINFAYLFSISIDWSKDISQGTLLHIVLPFFWAYTISVLIDIFIIEE